MAEKYAKSRPEYILNMTTTALMGLNSISLCKALALNCTKHTPSRYYSHKTLELCRAHTRNVASVAVDLAAAACLC